MVRKARAGPTVGSSLCQRFIIRIRTQFSRCGGPPLNAAVVDVLQVEVIAGTHTDAELAQLDELEASKSGPMLYAPNITKPCKSRKRMEKDGKGEHVCDKNL